MRSTGFSRFSVRPLSMALGVVGMLALILGSPFALRALFADSETNWSLLSDIGQTYGAVSALLAAGALLLVGFSVALQAREVRHAREQAARGQQFDLMRMVLDDQFYRELFGVDAPGGLSAEEFRGDIYFNLLLNWWRMRWEFKDMLEREVRDAARNDFFAGQAGLDYWRRRGRARLLYAKTRRERRFEEMFAEEYEAAVAAGAARPGRRNGRRSARRQAGGGLLLLGAGLAIGALGSRFRFRVRRS